MASRADTRSVRYEPRGYPPPPPRPTPTPAAAARQSSSAARVKVALDAVGPPVRWGCCLSDTPEHKLGLGVRMGGTAKGDEHRPHLEGFLSFNLGRGGKLQRGLVYVMDGEKRTPALVLRSSWFM